MKKVICSILCAALLCAFFPCAALAQEPLDPSLFTQDVERLRLVEGWIRSLVNVSADTVFIGDSITHGGEWEEYFPDQTIVNLGVVGDSVYGLAIRMGLIETLMPTKCFMMIGVNDLAYQEPLEEILGVYEQLLGELARQREEYGLTVYIQSVLPVDETSCSYDIRNQDIMALNQGIQQLASRYDMTFIEVYSAMLDEDGMLSDAYTMDGLHLSEAGYEVWRTVLQPFIDE